MKINLDADPVNMGTALTLIFKLLSANPNQEVGNRGAVYADENGVKFMMVKNQDSYTIRQVIE